MNTVGEAFRTAGKYFLTDHAKERIRQRLGISSEDGALSWVRTQIENANNVENVKGQAHYLADKFVIVCDGAKVITVKPAENSNQYMTVLRDAVAKEVRKLQSEYRRELRRSEIKVAETHLNLLRAKNPKTKKLIRDRLVEATDWKASIEDELKAINFAGKRYGVEE